LRQHVNPLSSFFQQPLELPSLGELFSAPELPLHLDIGCARGRFLLEMAPLQPDRNHLGLEIRRGLVQLAEADQERLGLNNLRYLFCNANVSLEQWLARLPPQSLQLVTIQFPDPWFKLRHHKRRMVQPQLLGALAGAMAPGVPLFLQSDIAEVITQMLEAVAECGGFSAADGGQWLATNPLELPSERELYVLSQGLPVYRRLFRRTSQPWALHNPSATPPASP
jgi:tRNA (guanine-N7-)-methyltransferase